MFQKEYIFIENASWISVCLMRVYIYLVIYFISDSYISWEYTPFWGVPAFRNTSVCRYCFKHRNDWYYVCCYVEERFFFFSVYYWTLSLCVKLIDFDGFWTRNSKNIGGFEEMQSFVLEEVFLPGVTLKGIQYFPTHWNQIRCFIIMFALNSACKIT